MDRHRIDRRRVLGWAALLPMAAIAGCAAGPGGYSLAEGVRRLLTLSTQRAFARLLQPGGFYEDHLARIAPPEAAEPERRRWQPQPGRSVR